jgi:hypothetical protein
VAAILVAQIEFDGAVIEILAFERAVRRVLVVESEAQLPATDGEGAVGK